MKVIISQPDLFPWVGTFEKIRRADIFVHLDDVQFSKGSFTNRTKIKTSAGTKWLTVPLRNLRSGQAINEVRIDASQNWRHRHLEFLQQQYQASPFIVEMKALVERVYAEDRTLISELAIRSIEEVCAYYGLTPAEGFVRSSDLDIKGEKTYRILNIVRQLGGDVYVCGPGSQPLSERYLDHDALERANIRIEYMQYEKRPYSQQYGSFTPLVSVLDLIANEGISGRDLISSNSVYWRKLVW